MLIHYLLYENCIHKKIDIQQKSLKMLEQIAVCGTGDCQMNIFKLVIFHQNSVMIKNWRQIRCNTHLCTILCLL
jgi:hypothetical protein